MTQVCIAGAGAIGSVIGARLAAVRQCEASAFARGDVIEAYAKQTTFCPVLANDDIDPFLSNEKESA